MTNEELNTALYQKMFAEQEKYRDWLLTQSPDEILHHCYEYTVREDIVLALEEYDLSDKQCKALLKSPCPLDDVFKDFENPAIPAMYNPLLMYKDFNSNADLSSDNSFMVNADVPFLALKDLNLSDTNPFTGKKLEQQKTGGVDLYPLSNGEHHADQLLKKTKFTLDVSRAWHVTDDIFVKENWIPLSEYKANSDGEEK